MKLIVSGSPDFDDRDQLYAVLDAFHRTEPIQLILTGRLANRDRFTGRRWGANHWGQEWACRNKIVYQLYDVTDGKDWLAQMVAAADAAVILDDDGREAEELLRAAKVAKLRTKTITFTPVTEDEEELVGIDWEDL